VKGFSHSALRLTKCDPLVVVVARLAGMNYYPDNGGEQFVVERFACKQSSRGQSDHDSVFIPQL